MGTKVNTVQGAGAHLRFCRLVRLDIEVNLAHGLFDQANAIWPFRRGVYYALSDHSSNFFPKVPELGFSFLFADL
jgi:hypothetical protein